MSLYKIISWALLELYNRFPHYIKWLYSKNVNINAVIVKYFSLERIFLYFLFLMKKDTIIKKFILSI